MGDFFHGWRRKIGVATLVMACMFAAAWARSHASIDMYSFVRNTTLYQMTSVYGSFGFATSELGYHPPGSMFESGMWTTTEIESFGPSSKAESLLQYFGFVFTSEAGHSQWMIPYWSIVSPLTLLSAYLLIVKPRPKNPTAKST